MRRITVAVIILATRGAISPGAQSPQTPATEAILKTTGAVDPANIGSLLKGKGIVGKLTKTVSTKSAKAGDAVEVEVTQDAKLGDQVLLRKGSLVKGTIAQVGVFSKGKSGAELEIVFDAVAPKTGEQISTHLIIYALAADVPAQPDDIYSSKGKQGLANSASVSGQAGGPNAAGELTPQTVGIFGFDKIELHPLARQAPPTSSVNSPSGNITLEKGTKIVLVFVGQ
jgi:hypothetical protein